MAIRTEPLWRNRSARRPIPVWIAPVFIVTVMNAPTASTNSSSPWASEHEGSSRYVPGTGPSVFRVNLVGPGGDEEGGDPDDQQDRGEDREGSRELQLLRLGRRGRRRRLADDVGHARSIPPDAHGAQ